MHTLQELWRYNDWANRQIIGNFETHAGSIPDSCLRLLSHIVNTQSTWLNRITGEAPVLSVWQIHELAGCLAWHIKTTESLKAVLEQYKDDLQHAVNYTNQTGRSFQNSVFEILLHVFNHGTYHRAQIAQEMRRNGLEPVNTDYITLVR